MKNEEFVAKYQERWTKTRSLGPVKYILLHGIVYFGLNFGLLFATAFSLLTRLMPGTPLSFSEVFFEGIPWFLAFGLIMGTYVWIRSENDFKKHQEGYGSKSGSTE